MQRSPVAQPGTGDLCIGLFPLETPSAKGECGLKDAWKMLLLMKLKIANDLISKEALPPVSAVRSAAMGPSKIENAGC
jgi:hypothetical protein